MLHISVGFVSVLLLYTQNSLSFLLLSPKIANNLSLTLIIFKKNFWLPTLTVLNCSPLPLFRLVNLFISDRPQSIGSNFHLPPIIFSPSLRVPPVIFHAPLRNSRFPFQKQFHFTFAAQNKNLFFLS